ncbi:hypothetical protein OESDEN_06573 [Oesophagostomum dentatum]|uniref:Uncharacterized protein n=1 Tax=Oesophagostomum dentatum TaxID=61180 RepID=A0A0B1TDR9_OESDE|nr:hypothetical protein OESDEN_06573 [Oesophagostomum dentatum]
MGATRRLLRLRYGMLLPRCNGIAWLRSPRLAIAERQAIKYPRGQETPALRRLNARHDQQQEQMHPSGKRKVLVYCTVVRVVISVTKGSKKSLMDRFTDFLIRILVAIQNFCESVRRFFYHLYLVLRFIWQKPDVAWDLLCTTYHLIKVSYDAGLWSWSQLWDMLYATTIAPMINSEKAA